MARRPERGGPGGTGGGPGGTGGGPGGTGGGPGGTAAGPSATVTTITLRASEPGEISGLVSHIGLTRASGITGDRFRTTCCDIRRCWAMMNRGSTDDRPRIPGPSGGFIRPRRKGQCERCGAAARHLSRRVRSAGVPRPVVLLGPVCGWRPSGPGRPDPAGLPPNEVTAARGGGVRGGLPALGDRRAVPGRDGRPVRTAHGDDRLQRGPRRSGGGHGDPARAGPGPGRAVVRGHHVRAPVRLRTRPPSPPTSCRGSAMCWAPR